MAGTHVFGILIQGAKQLAAGAAEFRRSTAKPAGRRRRPPQRAALSVGSRFRGGRRFRPGGGTWLRAGQHGFYLPQHRPTARRLAGPHATAAGYAALGALFLVLSS